MDLANRPAIDVPGGADLASVLLRAVEVEASDVHLTVGEPPCFRYHGRIVPARMHALTAESLHHMLYDLLQDDQRRILETNKELDFALQLGDAARFRANCFYTLRGEGAVFRVIPTKVLTFEQLGLPKVLKKICTRPRGLALVTGPTGSGKSTTLAAMIDYVNSSRDDHIITIEDPIEFVHSNKRCIVNQRELGSNTKSFAAALKSALREDPDIVLVGELRDLETISLALTASETGHLVFGTLHTQSAAKTVDRIVDVFPPEQQKLVRLMFAETFEAVVCQALVPRADGRGRVLAMEVMLGTPSSRAMIRDGKTHQLETVLQTSAKLGMQALDANLKDLLQRRVISEYEALSRANNPDSVMPGGANKLEELLARQDVATAHPPLQAPPPGAAPPPPPGAVAAMRQQAAPPAQHQQPHAPRVSPPRPPAPAPPPMPPQGHPAGYKEDPTPIEAPPSAARLRQAAQSPPPPAPPGPPAAPSANPPPQRVRAPMPGDPPAPPPERPKPQFPFGPKQG